MQDISAKIISSFKNYYIHFDLAATIPCETIGAPKPTISWLVNSTRVVSNSKYNINENGSLVIQNIRVADEGTYTCAASNFIHTDYKTTIVYAVKKTKIIKFPPKELAVEKGDSPILVCEVEHDKRVNYTREWRKAGIPIRKDFKRYMVQPDGALQVEFVREVDTNLEFSCHIFADDGNYSASTVLILERMCCFIYANLFLIQIK